MPQTHAVQVGIAIAQRHQWKAALQKVQGRARVLEKLYTVALAHEHLVRGLHQLGVFLVGAQGSTQKLGAQGAQVVLHVGHVCQHLLTQSLPLGLIGQKVSGLGGLGPQPVLQTVLGTCNHRPNGP